MTQFLSRLSRTTMAAALLACAAPLTFPLAAEASDDLALRVHTANEVLKEFQAKIGRAHV